MNMWDRNGQSDGVRRREKDEERQKGRGRVEMMGGLTSRPGTKVGWGHAGLNLSWQLVGLDPGNYTKHRDASSHRVSRLSCTETNATAAHTPAHPFKVAAIPPFLYSPVSHGNILHGCTVLEPFNLSSNQTILQNVFTMEYNIFTDKWEAVMLVVQGLALTFRYCLQYDCRLLAPWGTTYHFPFLSSWPQVPLHHPIHQKLHSEKQTLFNFSTRLQNQPVILKNTKNTPPMNIFFVWHTMTKAGRRCMQVVSENSSH